MSVEFYIAGTLIATYISLNFPIPLSVKGQVLW